MNSHVTRKRTPARHESIPLDLLYTTMDDDFLHVRILSPGESKIPAERRGKQVVYLRYFLGKAFKGSSRIRLT